MLIFDGQQFYSNFDVLLSGEEVPCAKFVFCDSAVIQCDSHIMLAVPSEKMAHCDVHVLDLSKLILQSSRSDDEKTPLSTLSRSIKPISARTYGLCMRMRLIKSRTHKPRLVVGYESGALTLWDPLSGNLLNEIKGHNDSIMAMDCWASKDFSVVRCVTGSVDELLKSWQIEDDVFVEHSSVSVTNPGCGAIAIREDGRIFASGGWDHMGRVFSLRKLNPLAVLTYHRDSIYCVAFAPDNTLATGSKDGYIALWDVYKNK